jgi:hypothetical protein
MEEQKLDRFTRWPGMTREEKSDQLQRWVERRYSASLKNRLVHVLSSIMTLHSADPRALKAKHREMERMT